MSFLNIYSHLQANSVKSVSYFFKRTSSSQVTIEIGQNPPKLSEFWLIAGAIFQYEILCSEQKKKLFAALEDNDGSQGDAG